MLKKKKVMTTMVAGMHLLAIRKNVILKTQISFSQVMFHNLKNFKRKNKMIKIPHKFKVAKFHNKISAKVMIKVFNLTNHKF